MDNEITTLKQKLEEEQVLQEEEENKLNAQPVIMPPKQKPSLLDAMKKPT